MSDKLEVKEHFDGILNTLIIDIVKLRNHMSGLKPQDDKQSHLEDLSNIQWHCLLCGHTWKGHVRINPQVPTNCSSCKRPDWNEIPKKGIQGLHDKKNCKQCMYVLGKKLEALEKLKSLEAALKDCA